MRTAGTFSKTADAKNACGTAAKATLPKISKENEQ
jgi:hypothetical protein